MPINYGIRDWSIRPANSNLYKQTNKEFIYLVLKGWKQKELRLSTMLKLVNLFITRVEIRNSETTLHAF